MDDPPPTGKYVITNQFFGKGMTPEEVAKYQGIHIDTLQTWCDNWGIQYPEPDPETHVKSLSKSNISLNYSDVDVPDYTASWEKEKDNNKSDSLDGALDW
jgi:hypothetical protein